MKIPSNIFPKNIESFLGKSELNLGFNKDFMITTLLGLISTIIGNRVKLKVKDGWIAQANLWLAILGKSGVKKSPSIKHILKPLQDLDKEEYKIFCKDLSEYKRALSNGEKNIEKPNYKQLVVDDTTIEALYGVIQKNSNGLLMYKDELATLFSDAKRYDGGGQEDKFLSLYDGDTIKINRKTNDEILRISSPYLSLIGGIQPEILIRNASKTRIDNGFMARMLFCYPMDIEYKVVESENISIGQDDYEAFIKNCHKVISEGQNKIISLTNDAREAHFKWCEDFTAPKINNIKTPSFESAYLSKGDNTVLKLALIIEFMCSIENKQPIQSVSLESMLKAQSLSLYFYKNFQNVQKLIGEGKTLLTHRQSELILSYLEAIEKKYSKKESVVMLLEEGFTNSEINQALDIPKPTISDWKKKWDNNLL